MSLSVKISKVVVHTCCPEGPETGQCTDYTWENGSWSPSEPYVWVFKNPANQCQPEPYIYRLWVYVTVVTGGVTKTVHVKVTNDQNSVVLDQTYQTSATELYPALLQFTAEDWMPPRDYTLTIEAWLEENPDVRDSLTITLHPKYPTLVTGWIPFITIEDLDTGDRWFYNRYTGNWYDKNNNVVSGCGAIPPNHRVRATFSSDCFTDLDMSVYMEVYDKDAQTRLGSTSKMIPAGTCGGDPWVVVEFPMPERNVNLLARGYFTTSVSSYTDEYTVTIPSTVAPPPPSPPPSPPPTPTPTPIATAPTIGAGFGLGIATPADLLQNMITIVAHLTLTATMIRVAMMLLSLLAVLI